MTPPAGASAAFWEGSSSVAPVLGWLAALIAVAFIGVSMLRQSQSKDSYLEAAQQALDALKAGNSSDASFIEIWRRWQFRRYLVPPQTDHVPEDDRQAFMAEYKRDFPDHAAHLHGSTDALVRRLTREGRDLPPPPNSKAGK